MIGKVYLVGAGPGAPDLITLRGAELLKRAGIVFYDALVHPETLAFAPQAKLVAVGKRCSRISTDQRFINRNLVEAAAKYAVVVRLKGGDPMLFGRAQEEIEALVAAGVPCEVVPGVTSALAASAEIGVSLTRRGMSRSVIFATPRVGEGEDTSDWAPGVANADTSVLYMAAGQAAQIALVLEQHGMSPATPVLIVENASLPNARQIGTTLRGLRERAGLGVDGPALLLLGQVYRERAHALIAAALLENASADERLQKRALPR
ncbi:MAG TPA: uroporphyrinogen-III C-methyltransferase [Burkholderiales bacterium]|nr:uroporphyrinogen-III C-methyltransferase [Burkholderiales bacterium]